VPSLALSIVPSITLSVVMPFGMLPLILNLMGHVVQEAPPGHVCAHLILNFSFVPELCFLTWL
jgi:hypothetical protein